MAKFINIKYCLINLDKVQEFKLRGSEILVYYEGEDTARHIIYDKQAEAKHAFENIPHLIDNAYVPGWVREENLRANAHVAHYAMDNSDWEELPF